MMLLVLGCIGLANADTPTRPPFDHIICADSIRHCAYVSVVEGVKVFEVTSGRSGEPSYSIAGWFPQSYLSDDGQKFVAIESIIAAGHESDQPVARLWIAGHPARNWLLKDILKGKSPSRSTSGYVWGHAVGFRGNDQFMLQLENGSSYALELR
jgi:hypothetical protein